MPATSCATRSASSAAGQLRSSSDPTPPRASTCCRADGSSKRPLPGSGAAGASPRTSKPASPAPSLGSSSPTSACSHAASQHPDFIGRIMSQTLRLWRVDFGREASPGPQPALQERHRISGIIWAGRRPRIDSQANRWTVIAEKKPAEPADKRPIRAPKYAFARLARGQAARMTG